MTNNKDSHCEYLTTNQGIPITNDEYSLTAGCDGPVLMEDMQLMEEINHFSREKIPERAAHAHGSGAHGHFKLFNSMEKYTKAQIFTDTKCTTKTFVRFSTVSGARGSAETVRDPRGFAVKFYTLEGNYDIVGLNVPVFFIRDAKKFMNMLHAFRPSPVTNLLDPNMFWDFISTTPESTHAITYLFSDMGTRKSFIRMPGFGLHTFVWVNKEGKRTYVKYHWKPLAGDETISAREAEILAGLDPSIATRELYDTLSLGKAADWDLYVQLMDPDTADCLDFNPVDPTKIWPECDYPLKKVGRLTLTHGNNNFFEESEQVAFNPSHLPPGIELSYDKLLQGRIIAYDNAQMYRIGTNYQQLEINRPIVPVCNNFRDGQMEIFKHTGEINYTPNRLNCNKPSISPKYSPPPPIHCEGLISRQPYPHQKMNDFYQAGELYKSFSKTEKDHLIDNLVTNLKDINKDIQKIIIGFLMKANKDYGSRVAMGLHIDC